MPTSIQKLKKLERAYTNLAKAFRSVLRARKGLVYTQPNKGPYQVGEEISYAEYVDKLSKDLQNNIEEKILATNGRIYPENILKKAIKEEKKKAAKSRK
jgi:hypothetical protein